MVEILIHVEAGLGVAHEFIVGRIGGDAFIVDEE